MRRQDINFSYCQDVGLLADLLLLWPSANKVNVGTPQAYTLPLANSYGGSGYYFKTQNNIVTLQCWCSGNGFKAGDIVAVLPVGFRPSRATIEVPINYYVPGVGPASAAIYIRNTGNIEIVYGSTNASSFSMSCATFVAEQ